MHTLPFGGCARSVMAARYIHHTLLFSLTTLPLNQVVGGQGTLATYKQMANRHNARRPKSALSASRGRAW